MQVITTIIQLLIGGFFLVMGCRKLSPSGGPDAAIFARVGLPRPVLKLAGAVNIVGGTALLLGLWQSAPAIFGGFVLSAYLLLAIGTALLPTPKDLPDAARLTFMLLLCGLVLAYRL